MLQAISSPKCTEYYVNRTEFVLPKGNIPFDPDNRTQTPYANMSLQTLRLLGQSDAYYGNSVKFIQFEACHCWFKHVESDACNFLYELKFVALRFVMHKFPYMEILTFLFLVSF